MERTRRGQFSDHLPFQLYRRASILSLSEQAYSSKTWKLVTGEPMHSESGYWRPKFDGTIEVVIAQSTGLVEVQKGAYNAEERSVKLQSELVGNASKVKEINRVLEMVNGELMSVVEMATSHTTLQTHLKAVLRKI